MCARVLLQERDRILASLPPAPRRFSNEELMEQLQQWSKMNGVTLQMVQQGQAGGSLSVQVLEDVAGGAT